MFFALYSVDLIDELRGYDAVPNNVVFYVKGIAAIFDQPMHPYKFDTSSLATDDNFNVIKPISIGTGTPGRWIRMPGDALSAGQIVAGLGFTPYPDTNPSGYIASINSTQIATALGYTPVSPGRTITINGNTQDLSDNRTWNVSGQTVTLANGRGISVTGAYPNFTISLVTPTITIAARSLNTNFTINATKEAIVTYTVTCSVTNPLLVGTSSATAFLEYSTNGGSSWLLPSQVGNSSGVGITVTLQLTNGQTGTLVGMIPANALVRIRTTTAGTANVTYVTGSEMVY